MIKKKIFLFIKSLDENNIKNAQKYYIKIKLFNEKQKYDASLPDGFLDFLKFIISLFFFK